MIDRGWEIKRGRGARKLSDRKGSRVVSNLRHVMAEVIKEKRKLTLAVIKLLAAFDNQSGVSSGDAEKGKVN